MVVVHLVIVSLLITAIQNARILGVIPVPSYSHQIVFRPIWNELSRRGHEVVVITTDPQNNPDLNLTEIDISFAYDLWRERQVIKLFNDYKYNLIKLFALTTEIMTDLTIHELLHPGVQGILKNESEHFDLVMVEYVLPTMFGFSERFNCPYIGVVSMELANSYHSILGNPAHPVLYPDAINSRIIGKQNFWQRLGTTLYALIIKTLHPLPDGFNKPAITEFLREQFGKDLPPVTDIMKKVSMVFINDNPSSNVRPLGPAFVLFGGGTHLTPVKPLPKVTID